MEHGCAQGAGDRRRTPLRGLTLTRMYSQLLTLHRDPVFLRRDAIAAGLDDRALRALVRAGEAVRIRRGAYVDAEVWRAADDVERFRLRGRAVLLTHPEVALSHTSAAAEWGLRLWGADLGRVHVTRIDGHQGVPARDVAYHHGKVRPDEVVHDGDRRLVLPLRAAVETAMVNEIECGVCCLDTLLDPRLDLPGVAPVAPDDLTRAVRSVGHWPGALRLQITARLVRVGSQSVGESRSRVMCWRHRLPEPQLQFEVRDGSRLVAVTDFAWPEHRLLGEFDGKGKYLRPHDPGQDPGEVVFAEKKREDLARALTGFGMARWTWGDLEAGRQPATAAYLRRALGLD